MEPPGRCSVTGLDIATVTGQGLNSRQTRRTPGGDFQWPPMGTFAGHHRGLSHGHRQSSRSSVSFRPDQEGGAVRSAAQQVYTDFEQAEFLRSARRATGRGFNGGGVGQLPTADGLPGPAALALPRRAPQPRRHWIEHRCKDRRRQRAAGLTHAGRERCRLRQPGRRCGRRQLRQCQPQRSSPGCTVRWWPALGTGPSQRASQARSRHVRRASWAVAR